MQQSQNNENLKSAAIRIAADNPKAVIAAVLITVMALLWMRVFLKASQENVSAVAVETNSTDAVRDAWQKSRSEEKGFTYIDLPVMPGRNDILTSDLFAPKKWYLTKTGESNVKVDMFENSHADENIHKNNIESLSEQLRVKAVFINPGGNAECFINDRLLKVGSKFNIKKDDFDYEFAVKDIDPEKVILKSAGLTVTLKMDQDDPGKIKKGNLPEENKNEQD